MFWAYRELWSRGTHSPLCPPPKQAFNALLCSVKVWAFLRSCLGPWIEYSIVIRQVQDKVFPQKDLQLSVSSDLKYDHNNRITITRLQSHQVHDFQQQLNNWWTFQTSDVHLENIGCKENDNNEAGPGIWTFQNSSKIFTGLK